MASLAASASGCIVGDGCRVAAIPKRPCYFRSTFHACFQPAGCACPTLPCCCYSTSIGSPCWRLCPAKTCRSFCPTTLAGQSACPARRRPPLARLPRRTPALDLGTRNCGESFVSGQEAGRRRRRRPERRATIVGLWPPARRRQLRRRR